MPEKLNDILSTLAADNALQQGDPVAANRVVLKQSADALGVKMASLRFFSKDRLIMRCMELYEHPSKWRKGAPDFKTGEMPRFFLAVENGAVMAVNDAENDRRSEELFDRILQIRDIVSVLVAPVRILGDLVGIVIFKHEGEKREWTQEERNFAGDIGQLSAQVLINAKRMRVEEKLRQYRGRLETLVEQRTTQLAQANTSLKREMALREQSESAFRESEERYRKLYMDAPIGIFQTDISPEAGRVLDVNPAFAKMLGYASTVELLDTINQSSIVDTIFAEPVEKHLKVIDEVLKTKGWYVYEQLYRRKNKSIMIARQRVRAVRDSEEKPLFLEGLAEDITQERLAEQKAKQLQAKLLDSQKREAIGILAGGIAHDFNNLLSPIIGFAELVGRQLPEDSKQRAQIDHILTAAGRARDLARQILAFSHKGKQERRPVLVQSLIEEAVQLLRHSLPATVEIRTHIDEFCDPVLVDPSQIQQVIMNLGTNAYHAMKEDGGVLDIRMRAYEQASEPFTGFPDAGPGPYVEISVADTGVGVDPALIEKVFDPYFTTKAAGEGTGLGLSMVHGIVSSHGGAIAVESKAGRGTTFRVYIPRLTSESEDVLESVEETIFLGERQRILVVDDEDQILEMLQEMLEFCNYDVIKTPGAEEALSAVKSSPEGIDLVITDLTMPGMTGVQLAKEIAGIRPEMPIILCTGFSDALNEAQVKDASIRKLLLKPIGMKALTTAIREVLGEEREETGNGSVEDKS